MKLHVQLELTLTERDLKDLKNVLRALLVSFVMVVRRQLVVRVARAIIAQVRLAQLLRSRVPLERIPVRQTYSTQHNAPLVHQATIAQVRRRHCTHVQQGRTRPKTIQSLRGHPATLRALRVLQDTIAHRPVQQKFNVVSVTILTCKRVYAQFVREVTIVAA